MKGASDREGVHYQRRRHLHFFIYLHVQILPRLRSLFVSGAGGRAARAGIHPHLGSDAPPRLFYGDFVNRPPGIVFSKSLLAFYKKSWINSRKCILFRILTLTIFHF